MGWIKDGFRGTLAAALIGLPLLSGCTDDRGDAGLGPGAGAPPQAGAGDTTPTGGMGPAGSVGGMGTDAGVGSGSGVGGTGLTTPGTASPGTGGPIDPGARSGSGSIESGPAGVGSGPENPR